MSTDPTPPKPSFREQITSYIDLLKMLIAPQKGPAPAKPKKAEKPPKPPKAAPAPQETAEAQPKRSFFASHPRAKRIIWQGSFAPAFWTTASILSLIVNLILIVILIIVARQLFVIKYMVGDKLIGGLYDNFVLMDSATIKAQVPVNETIVVEDTIPVVFDLPLEQGTVVTLIGDTPISQATIVLNGAVVPLNISLPKGTELGINLALVVPVSQTIPVRLNVPVNLSVNVNIPLKDTELHAPFAGLQKVVGPYNELLAPLPSDASKACPAFLSKFCQWFFSEAPK